jgi:type III secretory pathway component EscV
LFNFYFEPPPGGIKEGGFLMNAILQYVMNNPWHLVYAFLAALVIIWLFKKFTKLTFVVLAVIVAAAAYYWFTTPGSMDDKMKAAVEKPKTNMEGMVEKGKGFLEGEKEKASAIPEKKEAAEEKQKVN